MGNNNCKNLHEYSDACAMSPCIQKIKGLPSNSASPTGTWIIEFKNGTNYEGLNIRKVFMKWFVSTDSLSLYDIDKLDRDYIGDISGLEYEIDIYRGVIRPLIDLNICPNFIRYLGSGVRCSFKDLRNMLKDHVPIDIYNIEKNLERNILYMLNAKRKRPSIEIITQDEKYDYIKEVKEETRYNLLLNELVNMDTTRTFSNILDNEFDNGITEEIWKIIFQVIAACYAMSLSKMVHNDLHTGNIYVERIPKTKVTYIIDGKCYTFETVNKVLLYDFDRSYVERFGINPKVLVESRSCTSSNQCNTFIPNKDMFKFFSYVTYELIDRSINPADLSKILNLLANNETAQNKIYKTFKSDSSAYWLRDPKTKKTWKEKDFKEFNSAENIIENIGNLIVNNAICKDMADIKNIFVCNKNMFDSNGSVIMENEAEIYRLKMEIELLKNDKNNKDKKPLNVVKKKKQIVKKVVKKKNLK
jgi:hypothetical protein